MFFIFFCTICISENMNGMGHKLLHFVSFLQFLTMFKTIVGAGPASCYGSGSDQKMRLLAAPAPALQH
jgi:Na+/glutamate symporter